MSLSSSIFGLTLSAALASSAPAAGADCAETRPGPHVAGLPEPWRKAVEELCASTATPGQPWSCAGGQVDLVLVDASRATLSVQGADGHTITRDVGAPEDVQPLGEALLAMPLLPPPPLAEPEAPAAPAKLADPRVLVSALVAPRIAAGSQVLWGGATLAAAIPFGRWGGGLFVRYDGPYVSLDHPVHPIHEVVVGASGFRSFPLGPVELRGAFRPALAVVARSIDRDQPGETHFDLRLGLEAALLVPFNRWLRGVVALDGELAPVQLAHEDHPSRDRLSLPPAFLPKATVGLGLGLEVAIR